MSVTPGALLDKDPNAELPYSMDWSAWLGEGVTIVTSTWLISPSAGLTQSDDEILDGDQSTHVWLSGGTLGRTYTVTNRITTNETPARTDDRSFYLRIVQR